MLFTLLISDGVGEITGSVEVDVPVDLLTIEFREIGGVLLRYVGIAVELADDRAIFTFNPSIVITVPGSRFCEFNA